jgi:hypothetical protein
MLCDYFQTIQLTEAKEMGFHTIFITKTGGAPVKKGLCYRTSICVQTSIICEQIETMTYNSSPF